MANWRDPDTDDRKAVRVSLTMRPSMRRLIADEAAKDEVSDAQVIRRALRFYFTRSQQDA